MWQKDSISSSLTTISSCSRSSYRPQFFKFNYNVLLRILILSQFLSGQTTAITFLLTLLIIFKFQIIFYIFQPTEWILFCWVTISVCHILVHIITFKGSHFNTLSSKRNNLRIMALMMVSIRVTCIPVVMIHLMQASVATHSTVIRTPESWLNL